jgi:hypothetical protein
MNEKGVFMRDMGGDSTGLSGRPGFTSPVRATIVLILHVPPLRLIRDESITVPRRSKVRDCEEEQKNRQDGGYQTVNAEGADEGEIEIHEAYRTTHA